MKKYLKSTLVMAIVVASATIVYVLSCKYQRGRYVSLYMTNIEALAEDPETGVYDKYLNFTSRFVPIGKIEAYGENGELLSTAYCFVKHVVLCYNKDANGTHTCFMEGDNTHLEKYDSKTYSFICPFSEILK